MSHVVVVVVSVCSPPPGKRCYVKSWTVMVASAGLYVWWCVVSVTQPRRGQTSAVRLVSAASVSAVAPPRDAPPRSPLPAVSSSCQSRSPVAVRPPLAWSASFSPSMHPCHPCCQLSLSSASSPAVLSTEPENDNPIVGSTTLIRFPRSRSKHTRSAYDRHRVSDGYNITLHCDLSRTQQQTTTTQHAPASEGRPSPRALKHLQNRQKWAGICADEIRILDYSKVPSAQP